MRKKGSLIGKDEKVAQTTCLKIITASNMQKYYFTNMWPQSFQLLLHLSASAGVRKRY